MTLSTDNSDDDYLQRIMDGTGDNPTDFTLCFIHHNAFHAKYETQVPFEAPVSKPQIWVQIHTKFN